MSIEINNDSIYISDEWGEIVSWVESEWVEEPDVAMVIANAVKEFYTKGSFALRAALGKLGDIPRSIYDDPTVETWKDVQANYKGLWVVMEEVSKNRVFDDDTQVKVHSSTPDGNLVYTLIPEDANYPIACFYIDKD